MHVHQVGPCVETIDWPDEENAAMQAISFYRLVSYTFRTDKNFHKFIHKGEIALAKNDRQDRFCCRYSDHPE